MVIVSRNALNEAVSKIGYGVPTVVPLTSNTGKVYEFQTILPAADTGLTHDSKAQAEQVRSVAIERFAHQVGGVNAELLAQIDEALRIHLDL